jgi:hypothetical protein
VQLWDKLVALSDSKIDHYLLYVSTVFVILTTAAYCFREFIQPLYRRWRLKEPARSYFIVTSKDRFDLKYAVQDEGEHKLEYLVLPSHTHALLLHIVLEAKIDFMQNGLEFVFEGDGRKPLFNYWHHPFVRTGTSTKKPGEHPGHYIDYHDNYHIEGNRQVAKGLSQTSAFMITTRDPGIYYLKVNIIADGVDGVAEGTRGAIGLRVRVEDHPTTKMKCELPRRSREWHKRHDIEPQPVLKA